MIKNQVLNLYIFCSIILNPFVGFGQEKLDRNYHFEVLTKMLSDSNFLQRFAISKKNSQGTEVIVVVPSAYTFKADEINGIRISSTDEKDKVCHFVGNNYTTVILMASINVTDSSNEFTIPFTCYQLHKAKGKCKWKIFPGGALLNNFQYRYAFGYDEKLKKWILK